MADQNHKKKSSRRAAIKRIGLVSCVALIPGKIGSAVPDPVPMACYNSCAYASQSEYFYVEGNPMPLYQSISYSSCYNSCG